MKIRSITTFASPGWPLQSKVLEQLGRLLQAARPAFDLAGYEVQTTRLATEPFPRMVDAERPVEVVALAQALSQAARDLGIDYVCLGPALPDIPGSYEAIPPAINATEGVFFAGMMTVGSGAVSLPSVRHCAAVIHTLSDYLPNGFANLRFAALANVPAGAPFFPAAYHAGGAPAFALAVEAADLAVQAFSQAGSLQEARDRLVRSIELHAARLQAAAEHLAQQHQVEFLGLDFTLAPFPEASRSIGTALEALGPAALGLSGSLAAAAFLMDTLDRARFKRTGFNGLMLPVLEDAILAQRADEGLLTVQDLLLYSAVCGTGLDTVPLPGDTPIGALEAVLLDLAALAVRLGKPLTARLMPIPGKQAGDPTDFDFVFFAKSRVMGLRADSLVKHFAGGETFDLSRRPAQA